MRPRLPTPSSWFARPAATSNALATVAVLISLTGTAVAATVFTGASVRDETLTGADVRNLSLGANDVSLTAQTQLRVRGNQGAPGATGQPGIDGATGDPGRQGGTGPKGDPAPRAFTFQTAARSTRIGSHEANPASTVDPDECVAGDLLINCMGAPLTTIDGQLRYPRWNYHCMSVFGDADTKHCNVAAVSVPRLTRSLNPVLVTSENPSGGLLQMNADGTIVLNASATFYTQRYSVIQQRLECQLQVARVENGVMLDPIDVGVPSSTYRFMNQDTTKRNERERLLTIAVTGAIDVTAGSYETQLSCRAPDDTGTDNERLEFIEGNLGVLSTRSNGNA